MSSWAGAPGSGFTTATVGAAVARVTSFNVVLARMRDTMPSAAARTATTAIAIRTARKRGAGAGGGACTPGSRETSGLMGPPGDRGKPISCPLAPVEEAEEDRHEEERRGRSGE